MYYCPHQVTAACAVGQGLKGLLGQETFNSETGSAGRVVTAHILTTASLIGFFLRGPCRLPLTCGDSWTQEVCRGREDLDFGAAKDPSQGWWAVRAAWDSAGARAGEG